MHRAYIVVVFLLISLSGLHAQTDIRAIDQKFFEFDTYPFELSESSGKWGLKFKEVYDRALAINYLKRNYHYNTRVDTLVKNAWLALPLYDKFERWSYGPRFQFIVGTRKDKVDFFTLSGEILGSNVSDFLPEKVNLEKSDVVMTLKTGNKWKWYYEGDFYNKNTTIYFNSPEFDKMEIVRDTLLANFNFITEVHGVKQRYNVVGHELSGNVLAVATKPQPKEEVKPKTPAVADKKTETKSIAKPEETFTANETQALLSSAQAEIVLLKKQLQEEQKARIAAEQKAAEQTKRAEQAEQAKAAAEAKAKNEEQEKLSAQKALREALEKAKAADQQLTSAEAEQKAKKEAEIKAAVEKALKQADEQSKLAVEAAASEAQKAKQEAELAKANAEKERKEKAAAELKAKQEAEAKVAAEKKIKEEEEAKKAEAVKLAVEKALKEAELKAQQEAAAAQLKAKEDAEKQKRIAELEAQAAAKKTAEQEKIKREEEQKAAFAKALQEAEEKARTEARLKAEAEAAHFAEVEKKKILNEVKQEKAPEILQQNSDTAVLQDRNVIMQKIMARDKMLTYSFFKEKELFGLKSEEGNVLIYPAFQNIKTTTPSNKELKLVNVHSVITLQLDGKVYTISEYEFGGPEKLHCDGGFMLVWSKGSGRYVVANSLLPQR